jgi:RND family efflux transporter MFP subunit
MKTLLKVLLPFVAIAVGVVLFQILVKTKPEAARASTKRPAPLVEAITAQPSAERALIQGQGTVTAAQQIVLQPEIAGRLTELHPNLVPGGLLQQGEVAARVDARDYRLIVNQQEASLENARFNLQIEASRRAVAQREWELLGNALPATEEGKAVALRVPHERNAQATLRGAQSAVEIARHNLSRTTIPVPFNAIVQDERVDKGQLVNAQTQMATLVGTDTFWVQVNLPVERLGTFDLPGVTPGVTQGARATLRQNIGGQSVAREGRVLRLLGSLDPAGRMAQVIVEVQDPLRLKGGGGLPLLLGAFVQVEIEGQTLDQVYKLPSRAVRAGDLAWVVDPQGALVHKPVQIIWAYQDHVLIRGLSPGDRVITGGLAAPVPGMALRVEGDPKPAPTPAKDDAQKEGKP